MKITGTVREYPGGDPVVGAGVTYKLDHDDSTLGTDTTDANGRHDLTLNGNPGPWTWTATDATQDPDVLRKQSSQSYGSGGAYSLYELVYALRALGNGVVRGYGSALATTYDGAGLDLDVGTGATVIKGIPAGFPAVTDFAVTATRDATNPRQCYLCVETTGAGETREGRTRLVEVCGTAAASPSLPALTQTEATYQLPIYTFRLPNNSSTTLSQLTDVRTYCLDRNPTLTDVQRHDATELTTTSTSGANATGLTSSVTLLNGVVYDVEVRGHLQTKIDSGANIAQMAVYINGTSNISTFITTANTSFTGLNNVHYLEVTGTGAAITCGIRIKVSAGTMTYATGYLMTIARPRT